MRSLLIILDPDRLNDSLIHRIGCLLFQDLGYEGSTVQGIFYLLYAFWYSETQLELPEKI